MTNLWKRMMAGAAVVGGLAVVGLLLAPASADAAGRGKGQGQGYAAGAAAGAGMHRGMMGGGMMGGGMHRGMNGGMMNMQPAMQQEHMATVATMLGMTTDELTAALQSGRTVADLAAEKQVELSTITEAMAAVRTAHLDELVAAGTITREQADLMLSRMGQMGAGTCPMAQSGGK